MAATGLPASKTAMRKSTAAASRRSWSALATPPGEDDGVVVVGAHPVGDAGPPGSGRPGRGGASSRPCPDCGCDELGDAPGVDDGPPGPQQLVLLDPLVGHDEGDPHVLQLVPQHDFHPHGDSFPRSPGPSDPHPSSSTRASGSPAPTQLIPRGRGWSNRRIFGAPFRGGVHWCVIRSDRANGETRARNRGGRDPVGRRGEGQAHRPPRPRDGHGGALPGWPQRRPPHRRQRRGLRPPAGAERHPLRPHHADHRQRRRGRPGRAARGARHAWPPRASTPRAWS